MTDEKKRRETYERSGSEGTEWGEASRPASGKRDRLASMVSVRFSPEEIGQIRAAAEGEGVSVSAYIRAAAVQASHHESQVWWACVRSEPTDQLGFFVLNGPAQTSGQRTGPVTD